MNNKTQWVLARNLRILRKSNCTSHSVVSDDIGLNNETYLLYESGKRVPDAETLYKIAHRFGCDLDDLFIEDYYKFMGTISTTHYYSDKEIKLVMLFNKLGDFYKGMLMGQLQIFEDMESHMDENKIKFEKSLIQP